MADSYAQLAMAKRAPPQSYTVHQSLPDTAAPVGSITELQDKLLSLAKLLKSTQMCHDDSSADQRQELQVLACRMQQLEEAVQRQAASSSLMAAPGANSIKALAERLVLVERQSAEGFSENREVHSHNAEVREC